MIERMLEPGSTDLPGCRCGAEMELRRIEKRQNDTELKFFRCPKCRHEMRLMIWSEESVDSHI